MQLNLHNKPQRRVMKVLKWSDNLKYVELIRREVQAYITDFSLIQEYLKSSSKDYFIFTLPMEILVITLFSNGEDLKERIK